MMKDYGQLAKDVIEAVGGKENIAHFTHCVTRLRFNLKNDALVNVEEVKKIKGVIGAQFSTNQFQVIIGQDVEMAYEEACKLLDMSPEKGVDENLDKDLTSKEPFSVKRVVNGVIDALSGSLVAILPAMIAGGMIKMIYTLLGPTMLNVLSDTSSTYRILSIVGDAAFYFLPVYCAYTAAKKFNADVVIALLLCSVLIHPQLIELINSGEPLNVYGIPMKGVGYANTVLASVMIVYVQSLIEKVLKKYSPAMLRTIIVPLCTTLIMLPVALCVLGPLGSWIGELLSKAVLLIHDIFGPLAVALIAATFLLLVTTGAHQTLGTFCITQLFTIGYDDILLPASIASGFAVVAAALAFGIRSKDKDDKSLGFSCAVSQIFGGASEPTLFGILFPHKRIWGCLMVGAFAGGLYMGITKVACYLLAPSVYLVFMSFGGPASNTVNGLIGVAIAFAVTFVLTFFFGVTNKKGE
ncbi:MAG: PTS transporter subunit EIIC [Erysipelotrichaceae bacterium]|nr:PTS transporter subunit EIIC [Erysipelotrichaceae bacterium]